MLNGLYGRLVIAIEPAICFIVFGTITMAFIFFPLPAEARLSHFESAVVLAPIFGLAALAFLLYTVILLAAPLRALVQTFAPIYIVDGYVRYRRPDADTECNSNGYIAVLDDERNAVAEWASVGNSSLKDHVAPAMIEFSYYGGIHRIDGRSTGVLPATIAAMGVGNNVPRL
ncbi:MAG: hypothetical protein M3R53_05580 [Candidatus Eremiobacteraeota bacterium]|nr:hypothetical protein [Candidatus Eremiobacteraeota bacterium]